MDAEGWSEESDWRALALAWWHGRGRSIAIGCAVVLVAGALLFSWGVRTGRPPDVEFPFVASSTLRASSPTLTTVLDHVHVHVAGAVRTPGLYRVVEGSRVADVVDAAGGPLLDGDLDRVNLAALVVDGERIEVPRQGESTTATIATGSSGSALVDLNRGSQADLVALPGIGPSLAAAIIEHRERLGAFRTVDELEQVPGIGPAKLSALRDLVRV